LTKNPANAWPARYEKTKTLRISTIGRKTGKTHSRRIQFAVDADEKYYVATKDTRRDWVKNAKKSPSVAVTIKNTTRMVRAVALTSKADEDHFRSPYRKKYFMAKVLGFFHRVSLL